jgi:hypothetical protein
MNNYERLELLVVERHRQCLQERRGVTAPAHRAAECRGLPTGL